MHHKPDFIIAGAMKSGTTWLHDALNELPEIQIPREEIHWIDSMDPLAHPDFQQIDGKGLHLAAPEESNWYENYAHGNDVQGMLGYDSTTLFHSKIDLKQVAEFLPETKFIIILRNPVDRAYSHYWHLVRTGRARHRFERELLDGKREILDRSIYLDQVRRFLAAFGNRVHFICYERMFAEPEVVLTELLQFLDLPEDHVNILLQKRSVRSNPGRYPLFLGGWLFGARLLAGMERGRYARDVGLQRRSALASLHYGAYVSKLVIMALLAVGVTHRAPRMKTVTRKSLAAYFSEANMGLDELLGEGYTHWWY